jgi:hypothetical protein
MDIKYIQQFKDREEVQTLDENILNNILELFSSSNIKIKRYNNTEKKNSFNDNITIFSPYNRYLRGRVDAV